MRAQRAPVHISSPGFLMDQTRRARSAPVFHSCPGQTDCERRVAGLPVARSDAIPAIDRGRAKRRSREALPP